MLEADSIKPKALMANQRRGAGLFGRLGLYALIWWMLSGGEPASWAWGGPVVIAAALLNPWLPPAASWRWRLMGILRFVPLFLWYSLRSGIDVAWRATHSLRSLEPALIEYPWRLPPGPARIFLANTINLVPGTLSVRIKERAVTIHVLHDADTAVRYVQRLEWRVADLFGLLGDLADD